MSGFLRNVSVGGRLPERARVRCRLATYGVTVLLLFLVACGGTPAVTDPPDEPPATSVAITRAEYGSAWPFTVPSGTLYCHDDLLNGRQYVTFGTDGIEYGLNGSARDFGFPELDGSILRDFPNRSGTIDLITRALDLC